MGFFKKTAGSEHVVSRKKGEEKPGARKPFFPSLRPLLGRLRNILPRREGDEKNQAGSSFKYTFEEKRELVEALLKQHEPHFGGKVLHAKDAGTFAPLYGCECFYAIIDPRSGIELQYALILAPEGHKPIVHAEEVPTGIPGRDLPRRCFKCASQLKDRAERFPWNKFRDRLEALQAFHAFLHENKPQF